MGERVQLVEPFIAARVDDVHVAARRLVGRGHRPDHAAQRRRGPAPDRPDDRQVAVARRPPQRSAALAGGIVDQPDDAGVRPDRGEVLGVDAGRQRRQPRPVRRIEIGERGGVADRPHEHRELRLTARTDGRRVDDVEPVVVRRLGRTAAAGDLEHDVLVGSEAQHRPSGRAAREAHRRVIADDVTGIGHVVQPQRDAEVRVRPDVVADHPRRALRRQDEVDAEAAAALGDADERAQEVGKIGGERRELVDDDHQAGEGSAAAGAVVGQVAGAGGAQQVLATAHLGVEARQRPRRRARRRGP